MDGAERRQKDRAFLEIGRNAVGFLWNIPLVIFDMLLTIMPTNNETVTRLQCLFATLHFFIQSVLAVQIVPGRCETRWEHHVSGSTNHRK